MSPRTVSAVVAIALPAIVYPTLCPLVRPARVSYALHTPTLAPCAHMHVRAVGIGVSVSCMHMRYVLSSRLVPLADAGNPADRRCCNPGANTVLPMVAQDVSNLRVWI